MRHTNGPCVIGKKSVQDAGTFDDRVTGRLDHSDVTSEAMKRWGRPRTPLGKGKTKADQSLKTARPTISPINHD